jgi:hypothetical protein
MLMLFRIIKSLLIKLTMQLVTNPRFAKLYSNSVFHIELIAYISACFVNLIFSLCFCCSNILLSRTQLGRNSTRLYDIPKVSAVFEAKKEMDHFSLLNVNP